LSSEENGKNPFERADELPETPDDVGVLGGEWDRRKFLKAAALGTAAAALWQKGPGLSFGPAAAYANDLSNYPCTAGDVEVLGTGVVVGEPCVCSGTFTATVAFQVRNNTATGRYCITLHLVATTDADGNPIPAQDVILYTSPGGTDSTVPGQTTTTMYGQIESFPCNSGGTAICFGAPGTDGRGKCDPGTCSTVAWSTTPGDAGCTSPDQKPPRGQCRHQRICVTGFGISVVCADGSCAERSLTNGCCSVPCGGTLNVKVTAAGFSGDPCTTPLTIAVQRPGEAGFTNVTLNASGCYVDNSPVAGTYTFRATDCHGCSRTDALVVCVQSASIAAPTLTGNPCSGLAVFSPGAVTGGTGPFTYSWSLDGGAAVTGATFTYNPTLAAAGGLDTSCHSLVVTVTDANGCTATSPATTFSQCVNTTTGCTVT
jgi:hypothetical protein